MASAYSAAIPPTFLTGPPVTTAFDQLVPHRVFEAVEVGEAAGDRSEFGRRCDAVGVQGFDAGHEFGEGIGVVSAHFCCPFGVWWARYWRRASTATVFGFWVPASSMTAARSSGLSSARAAAISALSMLLILSQVVGGSFVVNAVARLV